MTNLDISRKRNYFSHCILTHDKVGDRIGKGFEVEQIQRYNFSETRRDRMGWYEESVVYQIYPLGFCGAPRKNNGKLVHRIRKIVDYIPYLKELGVDVLLLNPVFESDRHGYDTRDYSRLDVRLGEREDLAYVSEELHKNGIRLMLDGVFNHVGRGFFGFQDVLKHREASKFKDWFHIRFYDNNVYEDGLSYDGWEGHYDLVKLNLNNEQVVNYLLDAVTSWIKEFQVDGLRIDVAYCLNKTFLRRMKEHTRQLKSDFVLVGEVLFGDYNIFVNDEMLQSCTNYECYKGIYSSLNDLNLFEINYSLNRQFNHRQNGIYQGKHLLTFVDNHDVSRIASIVKNSNHLPLAYTLLFTIPGVPCIYYGSEWGEKADKKEGDYKLRPKISKPNKNDTFAFHKQLIEIYHKEPALQYGGSETISITNQQLVFKRQYQEETVVVALNADSMPIVLPLNEMKGTFLSLLTGEEVEIDREIRLEGYDVVILKLPLAK